MRLMRIFDTQWRSRRRGEAEDGANASAEGGILQPPVTEETGSARAQ